MTQHADDVAAEDGDQCPVCEGAGLVCPLGHCPICDLFFSYTSDWYDQNDPDRRLAWKGYLIVVQAWDGHNVRCGLCRSEGMIPLAADEEN